MCCGDVANQTHLPKVGRVSVSRKNQSGYKPKYGARELKRMTDELMKLAEQDCPPPEQPWLYVAAGHALDLYEVSREVRQGSKLDFTHASHDGLIYAIMLSSVQLTSSGTPSIEVRQTLAKRLAAYMMFQVYNDLDAAGYDVAFECQSSFVLSARWGEGETYRFDFLGRAMLAMRRFIIDDQDYEFIAGGSLHPFDHKLWVEFMKPLTESAGVSVENVEES